MRVAALGTSDCEALGSGLLAQPAAALSSVAFLGAAAWLAARLPARGAGRAAAAAFAGSLALVGIGSVDYHGPQSAGAAALHDASIALVLAQAVAVPAARVVRKRPALGSHQSPALRVAATAAVTGLAAYLAGRTGGPLCDPSSWAQPHALWHVCGALSLAAWGAALWPRRLPRCGGVRARRRARSPAASSPSAAGR